MCRILLLVNKNNKTNKTNNNKTRILSKPIDNIRSEIEKLLTEINTCIKKGFIYSQSLRIIIKFILLLSDQYDPAEEDKLFNKWINTPFIFFPSYMSINFQTVVALISAPIINFKISNRARSVHGTYSTPLYDAEHDIQFHAKKTHKFNLYGITISYINYFTTMNKLLALLFPYYYCTDCTKETDKTVYDDKETLKYSDLTDKNKKNVMSLLLFTLLHEMLFFGNLFKKYINNFDEILKYFNKSKKEIIVEQLKLEVSNNMFDMKYPFVSKLDWDTVVDAFIELIAELNKHGHAYDNLVKELPNV